MSAKPALSRLAAFSAAALAVLGAGVSSSLGAAPVPPPAKTTDLSAKAALPTVLLFPATPGDVAALVDLRTRLRLDNRVEVLTYDPESAAIERAAAEDAHPEWLISAPTSDAGRMALARALAVNFYAVVSPGRATDSTHVELVETAPAARTFDWTGSNRQFGVRAVESQVADSIAHPAAYDTVASGAASPVAAGSVLASPPMPAALPPAPISPTVPATTAAVPVAAVPIVPPVTVSIETVPAPVVVAAVPSAPIKIVLPTTPVSAAPTLPLLKNTPAPVKLPVVVAQAPPVTSIPVPISPPAAVPVPKVSAVTPPATAPTVPLPPAADASPLMAANAPPKAARAVPSPQMAMTVPTTKMDAPPLSALTLPKAVAVPTPKVPLTAALTPVPKPVRVATLPKPIIPVPLSALPTPTLPEHAPPTAQSMRTLPPNVAAPLTVKKAAAKAEDMSAIEPLLAKGDSALDGGDAVSAIALYRQAINGAPLSVVPRLKLAQAYQKDGLNDRALDEARRALEIAPDNVPVQQFLSDLDQQTGTTAGTLVRDRAVLKRDPTSPAAHSALADALWNNGDLSGAEAEYKAASALAPAGSHLGDAQLAQLYAAEARYGDCLAVLQTGGKGSYAVAIQIVKNRADTLSSTLSASRGAFAAGKSTREQFYDDAKKLSAEAQALAGFVAQISPPAQYKLSHLHRVLSTNLLAQESETLVSFIESGDSQQNDSISLLERAAATEMLTAQATEEKLGLWKEKP